MRRPRLNSVGAKLGFALLIVLTAALAVVYLVVVPSLENRLVSARKAQVERVSDQVQSGWRSSPDFLPDDLARAYASATNTRVTLLEIQSRAPLTLGVIGDGGAGGQVGNIDRDPLALSVARSYAPGTRVVERDGRKYAESARVVIPNVVALVSSSLTDVEQEVSLVERRILTAGVLALILALLAGYAASHVFARRIRRLERAADRIAGGSFDEPVVDPGHDELGELARAFDRMRERLARLERARREFIANASHELRTPLFSLAGHLELLTEEEMDEETREEFLQRSREQVDRLTKLAEELLDLSRLDAGRLSIERGPVDLDHVAELLVDEFAPVARRSEHALELRRNGDGAAALGDEQRVLQIGRALVQNALRHTPAGTTVQLRTERVDGRSVLAVEDDGPTGISEEHASHVFERFYRADGGLASGSGLGLAIARELVEVMDGSIDVDSRPGRTTFRVSLPTSSLAE